MLTISNIYIYTLYIHLDRECAVLRVLNLASWEFRDGISGADCVDFHMFINDCFTHTAAVQGFFSGLFNIY